jgi:hypothetical protein
MTDSTAIKVTKIQRDFIAKSAQKFKKNMGEFAYQCVFYIAKHRYDPYLMEDILIVDEFKKLKNQMISFIRTQEQDYIKPMHGSILDMKREVIIQNGLLQKLIINTSEVDYGKEEKETKLAIVDTSTKEIKRLEEALRLKDDSLRKAMGSLQAIKKAATIGKKEVILGLNSEEFNKLIQI